MLREIQMKIYACYDDNNSWHLMSLWIICCYSLSLFTIHKMISYTKQCQSFQINKHLQDCVESNVWLFLNAVSVRIPIQRDRVINEYVAPSIINGKTNKIPSRNKLYARS